MLDQRGATIKEFKSRDAGDAVKPTVDAEGLSVVPINDGTEFDINDAARSNDHKIKISIFKHNPVLKDSILGEVSQPISLVAASTQPAAFQDLMLLLQNAGKVEGKVHVQCTFK